MAKTLRSIEELKAESERKVKLNQNFRTSDRVLFTDIGDNCADGTVHEIMKLYDPDTGSIRLSFTYHIHGCFHTEYLENQPDTCDVEELIEMANLLYVDKVQHIKFVQQPDWIN